MQDEQPHLKDFLLGHIRETAIRENEALWVNRLDSLKSARTYNPNPASDYLLSHVFVARQDGEPLVGTLPGPKDGSRIAYYRHERAKRKNLKGSVFANLSRADFLYDALVALLKDVLLDAPVLRERHTPESSEILRHTGRCSSNSDLRSGGVIAVPESMRQTMFWRIYSVARMVCS